jgi:excisionase family DNA binding protein
MNGLLTVKEVAKYLKLHTNSVYKLAENGEIPCIRRKGLGLRFREKDIDSWLEKGTEETKKILETYPKFEPKIEDYDKVFLKGGSGLKSKKTRWRYVNGTVYLRENPGGSKSWGIEYRDENGKRKQIVIPNAQSRVDAVIALNKRVREVFNLQNDIVQPKKIKFGEYADLYLKDYAMMAKKSGKTDEFRLKRMKEFFKNIELRKITPLLIQKFRTERLNEGVAKITTNREVALLKKMFSMAIDDGYLEQNPAKKIKLYSELDTVRDRVLSDEEEPKLFSELAEHMKPFILSALHTGMRRGELFKLKWCNVDFDKQIIKVEETKSKKVRFIPINSVLFDELLKLKAMEGKEQRVFPFKNVRTAFEKACKRAGLEDLTFHDLRRTFGTRLLERGVDIVTISKLYGHSSVLVTQRYLHPKDTLSKEAVELLVENSSKNVKKEEKLLQICDTKRENKLKKFTIRSFSVN